MRASLRWYSSEELEDGVTYGGQSWLRRGSVDSAGGQLRVLGHLKINRAIATRYDQLADSFLGMLYLATARYWIKFVHAA